ncbi:hypothetical protein D3C75_976280 [compost metagenome]
MVLDTALLPSLSERLVASTSTRLPGNRNPPTPTTSSTRTDIARLSGAIKEARVLPPKCSLRRAPRTMSPLRMSNVAILPTAFSLESKASFGIVSMGMRTVVTCWGSTFCPKGISTVATTTLRRWSSGLALSRALNQESAIHAAPRPMAKETPIRVSVRELMSVSPYQRKSSWTK